MHEVYLRGEFRDNPGKQQENEEVRQKKAKE